jgi:hypothetical protein
MTAWPALRLDRADQVRSAGHCPSSADHRYAGVGHKFSAAMASFRARFRILATQRLEWRGRAVAAKSYRIDRRTNGRRGTGWSPGSAGSGTGRFVAPSHHCWFCAAGFALGTVTPTVGSLASEILQMVPSSTQTSFVPSRSGTGRADGGGPIGENGLNAEMPPQQPDVEHGCADHQRNVKIPCQLGPSTWHEPLSSIEERQH